MAGSIDLSIIIASSILVNAILISHFAQHNNIQNRKLIGKDTYMERLKDPQFACFPSVFSYVTTPMRSRLCFAVKRPVAGQWSVFFLIIVGFLMTETG